MSLPNEFETVEQANAWNATLIGRLQRAGCIELADRLAGCDDEHPCRSEACHVCRRTFRIKLLRATRKLRKGVWTSATILVRGLLIPPGQLSTFDLPTVLKRVRKWIERSTLRGTIILGGVDVSANMIENVFVCWQPHLYLLLNEPPTEALKESVRRTFPAEPSVHRPYRFGEPKTSADLLRVFTYVNKNRFARWSRYTDPDRPRADGSPGWNVDDGDLTSAQSVELAVWLSQYPVGARTIWNQWRRTSSPRSTRLRLQLNAPLVRP